MITNPGMRLGNMAGPRPSVRYCCTFTPESREDASSHECQDTMEGALEWLLDHAVEHRDTLEVRITLPGRRRCLVERRGNFRTRITAVVEPVLSDGSGLTVEVIISSHVRPHLLTVRCDNGT